MIIIQILSKTPCAKWEVLKNEKCTWSSRSCICSNVCHKNHLLNVSLKRKNRQHFHHHTAYDYRKESKSRWYTTARGWYKTSKQFFPRMLQIPISYRQMSQFTTNQAELLIFRSPVISAAGIRRSGVYADRQRNRYVLLLADQRLLLSLL